MCRGRTPELSVLEVISIEADQNHFLYQAVQHAQRIFDIFEWESVGFLLKCVDEKKKQVSQYS